MHPLAVSSLEWNRFPLGVDCIWATLPLVSAHFSILSSLEWDWFPLGVDSGLTCSLWDVSLQDLEEYPLAGLAPPRRQLLIRRHLEEPSPTELASVSGRSLCNWSEHWRRGKTNERIVRLTFEQFSGEDTVFAKKENYMCKGL